MFLWFPVLDLARAPRRTARKKGSGYENVQHADQPRTQALSTTHLAGGKTLVQAGHVSPRFWEITKVFHKGGGLSLFYRSSCRYQFDKVPAECVCFIKQMHVILVNGNSL